jgi:glycosyltransferase involved in cell wall biosynthesis
MKVLFILHGPPVPYHPPRARAYYFIKFFSSLCDITLVSLYNNNESEFKELLKLDPNVKLVMVRAPNLKNTLLKLFYSVGSRVTTTNLLYSRDWNFFGSIYYPTMQKRLLRLLEHEDFDVICVPDTMSSYIHNLRYLMKIRGSKVLDSSFPHLYAYKQFYRHGFPRFILGYLSYRLFEVKRYRSFDAGIYVSRTHLELSKPFLPKQCYIISPGVDVDFFKPLYVEPRNLSIGFIGTMSHIPNILSVFHFYHRIYSRIKNELPNVKFYVVGRNPVKKIKSLSRDPSVIITGAVEDIRNCYSMIDVVVNPIVVDDGGIKTKVLEAMAMGKPVVSTPLGVRDLGVTDGENVVIAKSDKEFAEKVVELLKDENERRRIGRNARKFVEENYSWERQSKTLYDVFRELAKGAR